MNCLLKTLSLNAIKTLFAKHKSKTDARYSSISIKKDVIVATDGNDSTADGSEERPFATIQAALDFLGEGCISCTIRIKAGTYTYERICIEYKHSVYITSYSGNCDVNLIMVGDRGFEIRQNLQVSLSHIKILFSSTSSDPNVQWSSCAIIVDGASMLYMSDVDIILQNAGLCINNQGVVNIDGTRFGFTYEKGTGKQCGIQSHYASISFINVVSCKVYTSKDSEIYHEPYYGWRSYGGIILCKDKFWGESAANLTSSTGEIRWVNQYNS